MGTLLEVKDLVITDSRSKKDIVKGISFSVEDNSCLAIVGESGSGKSMTCKTFMGLHKPWIKWSGDVFFEGVDIKTYSPKEMRTMCGKKLCMVMQNGMSAFDPSDKMKGHFRETLKVHYGYDKTKSDEEMIAAMEKVLLKEPEKILDKFPHQLSGGMLQRCMIALTLALKPQLIIADEPTTALDTITQYEVIQQFIELKQHMNNSMIFISHDLGVVRNIADNVIVMKTGEIVERGKTERVLYDPQHEYTKFLVNAKKGMNEAFNRIMSGGLKEANA